MITRFELLKGDLITQPGDTNYGIEVKVIIYDNKLIYCHLEYFQK